jgi:hypothetical protein
MLKHGLYAKIEKKNFDCEKIASEAAQNPEHIDLLLDGLNSETARIKYGCDKVLRFLSKENPSTLYPYFDLFAANLNSEKTILKWGAIDILANLASVDSKNRIKDVLDSYFSPIAGPVLITAANIAKGAARIALARPEYTGRVTQDLLKIEKGKYQTEECRQIALGQAIKSFDQFFDQIKYRKPVLEFVSRQLKSPRSSTKKLAEKFLKKHAGD